MRSLLLLRHAKSSWADAEVADHDRPLAPRGERAAAQLARHLLDEGIRPELVLCSSARRARETLDALGLDAQVKIEDGLYGAHARELLERLRRVEADPKSVMIVGHNPGLEDLAMGLAGDGDPAAMAQLHSKFPTAALATLDLGSTPWSDLGPDGAYLTSLVLPRDL